MCSMSGVPGGTQIDLHVGVLTRTDEAEHYPKGLRWLDLEF